MDSIDLSEDSIHEVEVLFEEALRAAAVEMSTDIWRAWSGGCKRWGRRSWARWWNGS